MDNENIELKISELEKNQAEIKIKQEYMQETLNKVKVDIADNTNLTNVLDKKIEKLTFALEKNTESQDKLTDYMEAQKNKPNEWVSKIILIAITALISGIIGKMFL